MKRSILAALHLQVEQPAPEVRNQLPVPLHLGAVENLADPDTVALDVADVAIDPLETVDPGKQRHRYEGRKPREQTTTSARAHQSPVGCMRTLL